MVGQHTVFVSVHDRPRAFFCTSLATKLCFGLSPQDRCHLNGMAMTEGRPCYVAGLGEADAADSWQKNKGRVGVLIDIDSSQTDWSVAPQCNWLPTG